MFLIISIIPRDLFNTTIIALNMVIELVECVSAILDIVKAMLGAVESYAADITYVMTLSIKGAMLGRENNR